MMRGNGLAGRMRRRCLAILLRPQGFDAERDLQKARSAFDALYRRRILTLRPSSSRGGKTAGLGRFDDRVREALSVQIETYENVGRRAGRRDAGPRCSLRFFMCRGLYSLAVCGPGADGFDSARRP